MNLITKFKHTVKSVDCGPDSKIRIYNLFLLFQEAAYLSAENLGFGYNALHEKNMTWVLSSLKIQIENLPEWNDPILVSTWPAGHNRLLGFREFKVVDEQENTLINATSEWIAIDLKSRRPMNINEFKITLPDTGERALPEKLGRLNPKRYGKGLKIWKVEVPYSAIDENGHVNNAEYVKWSLDALRKAKIDIHDFSTFQITFISELFENDKCEIVYQTEENGLAHVWGINAENKEFVFAVEIA